MVLFNYATRELTAKIVFYGPGLCGKTTNLEHIHKSLPEKTRGKMLSLATQTDRTLFFDFLPVDLGSIKGMKTRIQLYTVPGQVFYDATRKLVLKGADGVVFVVDSQKEMLESNLESWDNLKQNLKENGLDIETIPLVIQYNKRDLPNVMPLRQLHQKVNAINAPHYEAVALTGKGVHETLKGITKLVLETLSQRYAPKEEREEAVENATREASVKAAAPAVDEEVQELPAPAEIAVSSEAAIHLEPLLETFEEFDELEEIHDNEIAPPPQPEPEPEVEPEPEPEPQVVAEEIQERETLHADAEESPALEAPIFDEAEPVIPEMPVAPAPPEPKSVEVTAPVSIIATLDDAPNAQNVNVPVEVWVDRGQHEIRLQISINLKINVT